MPIFSDRTRPSAALRLWARSELRQRWRALVTLGVIAGLATGLALAAVAGARRTASSYERYRQATAAADALVFATQLGIPDQDYSAVLALPEVVDAGTFVLAPVAIAEHPMGTLAPGDDRLYRTLSRPLLRHGRLPDPERPDEIVVNQEAASTYSLGVGDQMTLVSSTDISDFFNGTKPSGGPSVRATVVGIGDSPLEAVFGMGPGFLPSAGFLARFPEVPRQPNLVVRLRPGTDVNAFHAKAAAALGLPDIPVRDLAEDRKRFTHATDLERTGLLLFAAASFLAALVLVGQALSRSVYAMAESTRVLRALGLTGAELVAGLVLPLTITAGTAAALTVGTALAVSERFPVGLARRIDPDLGLHADWLVLAPGAVIVGLVVLAGATVAGSRAVRRRPPRPASQRDPVLLGALRRRAPLPVAIGAGLALQGTGGDRSLPVRPALAGAVAGVLGVIGALGLVQGIDDAVDNPARAGQVWHASVFPSEAHPGKALTAALLREPDVSEVAGMLLAPLDVDGAGLPVYALDVVRGDLSFTVLRGRAPARPDEAAIGPASSKALGKGIGDRVEVTGSRGGTTLRVVGVALLAQTPHAEFDQGVWTTSAALNNVTTPNPDGGGVQVLVKARPGVEAAALVGRLDRVFDSVEPVSLPQDVLLLRNVRTLPRALAAFLVVLALAALGHALVTAVRRRGHDLAVLRALGFRPAQNALCIVSQAVTIAAVGLLLGIPLGAIAGRVTWRWVAEATPLLYHAPVAAVAMGLAVPFALAAANILACLPARRAARLRPAELLRAE